MHINTNEIRSNEYEINKKRYKFKIQTMYKNVPLVNI